MIGCRMAIVRYLESIGPVIVISSVANDKEQIIIAADSHRAAHCVKEVATITSALCPIEYRNNGLSITLSDQFSSAWNCGKLTCSGGTQSACTIFCDVMATSADR